MAVCEKHCCIYKDEIGCTYCFNEQRSKIKAETTDKVATLLQQKIKLFNQKQKNLYIVNNHIKCSTCPDKIHISVKGFYGMQWGHYFDKSIYWFYTFHKLNGAPQCYNCNVDKQGNKELLLEFLIKIHGQQTMADFITEVNNWYYKQKQLSVPESISLTFLKSIKI